MKGRRGLLLGLVGVLMTLGALLEWRVVAGEAPGMSLYQVPMTLTDQRGRGVGLDVYRGHPVIVSMFYASCPMACPLLIEDLKRIEGALDPQSRADLRVLLVSFDPERDTPAVMAETAAKHGVDGARWSLCQAPADQVRTLAAVLGVTYRRLPDGGFNHTSVMTLLDREGVAKARIDGLRQPADPFVAALAKLGRPGGAR